MMTPTNAEGIPAMRSKLSGDSSTVAMVRLAPPGNAASRMPSMAKNSPTATTKSFMPAGLFRRAAGVCGIGCSRRGRSGVRRRFAVRIAEIAEEIRIRPQHEMRIGMQHASLVGLHRTIEAEETRILAVGVGVDLVAGRVALAADCLGLRGSVRQQ